MRTIRLDVFVGKDPRELEELAKQTGVPVFSVEQRKKIGVCGKLERRGEELWADLELDDDAPIRVGMHAESLCQRLPDGSLQLRAVVLTSWARGMVQAALEGKPFDQAIAAAIEYQSKRAQRCDHKSVDSNVCLKCGASLR